MHNFLWIQLTLIRYKAKETLFDFLVISSEMFGSLPEMQT